MMSGEKENWKVTRQGYNVVGFKNTVVPVIEVLKKNNIAIQSLLLPPFIFPIDRWSHYSTQSHDIISRDILDHSRIPFIAGLKLSSAITCWTRFTARCLSRFLEIIIPRHPTSRNKSVIAYDTIHNFQSPLEFKHNFVSLLFQHFNSRRLHTRWRRNQHISYDKNPPYKTWLHLYGQVDVVVEKCSFRMQSPFSLQWSSSSSFRTL